MGRVNRVTRPESGKTGQDGAGGGWIMHPRHNRQDLNFVATFSFPMWASSLHSLRRQDRVPFG